MEKYKNLSGDSGVVSYEIDSESIHVYFNDGSSQFYTHQTSGRSNVEAMKTLAQKGEGLNSFIMQNIRTL